MYALMEIKHISFWFIMQIKMKRLIKDQLLQILLVNNCISSILLSFSVLDMCSDIYQYTFNNIAGPYKTMKHFQLAKYTSA